MHWLQLKNPRLFASYVKLKYKQFANNSNISFINLRGWSRVKTLWNIWLVLQTCVIAKLLVTYMKLWLYAASIPNLSEWRQCDISLQKDSRKFLNVKAYNMYDTNPLWHRAIYWDKQ